MGKRIFILFILIVMTAVFTPRGAASDNQAPPAEQIANGSAPATAAPKLVFRETTHDFGDLEAEQEVKHIFKFRNDGNVLLLIDNVKASCGCTGTLLSKKEIPPGGEGEIEVTFNSGSAGGKKKKYIDVNSNDPASPSVKLYIMANVVIAVELRPRSLYWLADRGEPSKRTAELIYQPGHEIKIVNLETSSPAFSATFRPKAGDNAAGYDIEITFDGSLSVDSFRERLDITTDNPKYQQMQISINGRVMGPVRSVPDSVNFGVITDELPPPRQIRVFFKDKSDFNITSIESSGSRVATEVTKDESSNEHRIVVRLTERPPQGSFMEKIMIKTDKDGEKPFEVPVYAYVR